MSRSYTEKRNWQNSTYTYEKFSENSNVAEACPTPLGGWYGYVLPSRSPLSWFFFASETHHFKSFFSSRDPTHIFKKKENAFSSSIFLFLGKFQLQRQTFSHKWVPKTLKPKNLFQRPYFWEPTWHIPTKNDLNYLPWVASSRGYIEMRHWV